MKTIDEVIEAIEVCRDSYVAGKIIKSDALHYLKEYKKYTDTMCALPDYYEWVHSTDNPPLTWDELRSMKGKPVWFEVTDPKALPVLDSGWGIVGCTSFSTWEGVESFSLVKVGVTYAVPTALYGRAWNVYRKERT